MTARIVLTPVALQRDAAVAQGAGTSIAGLVAAGATIPAPAGYKLIMVVTNSDTNPHNLIVRASRSGVDASGNAQSNPVWNTTYTQATVGDLTVAVAASTTVWVAPLTTDRYTQDDGSLSLDFSSGFTGTLWLARLPYNVA